MVDFGEVSLGIFNIPQFPSLNNLLDKMPLLYFELAGNKLTNDADHKLLYQSLTSILYLVHASDYILQHIVLTFPTSMYQLCLTIIYVPRPLFIRVLQNNKFQTELYYRLAFSGRASPRWQQFFTPRTFRLLYFLSKRACSLRYRGLNV